MSYVLKLPKVNFSAVAVDHVTYIESIPCTAISLSPSSLTFDTFEESKQITASLTPVNTTDTPVWASSNENVATVANGVVTIHGIGTATITATCGEQNATVSISATSLKITDIVPIQGKYTTYNDSKLYPNLLTDASNETILMTYSASKPVLHLYNSNEGQLFPVPYGASTIKVVTSDASSVYAYIYRFDTVDTVLQSGSEYAKWLNKEAKTITKAQAVSYGQAVGYQAGISTSLDLASYVLFE